MSVTILPFSAEHVESAAALLAVRHRHARSWAPDLSAEYEDPAATLPVLQDLLAADGASGVVALREGRVVAYLIGAPKLGSPTHPFAGFVRPRAADIPYAGHAADPGDGAALHPRLYATLAQQWVADGLTGHYVAVPADPDTLETWWDLGFSRFVALGVRSTAPPDERDGRHGMDIEVRRATPDDEAAARHW